MPPKFDSSTITQKKVSVPELIQAMQDYGLRLDHIAMLFGYGGGNQVAQLKCEHRTPGRKKLGTLYAISGGKLDLSLYLK